jgi:hypothetical protein
MKLSKVKLGRRSFGFGFDKHQESLMNSVIIQVDEKDNIIGPISKRQGQNYLKLI